MEILNFHQSYEAEIIKKTKSTTVRLGDKTGKYNAGQQVIITVIKQDFRQDKIGEAVIENCYLKKIKDLTEEDLAGESEDVNTQEKMKLALYTLHGKPISNNADVTVIKFHFI
ncbi:MAG: ASCH domain-containing protein [bacterium]